MVMVVHHVVAMHGAMVHSMMPRMRRGRAGGDRQDEAGGDRRCDDFQGFPPTFG
jgi:hypothetical protein